MTRTEARAILYGNAPTCAADLALARATLVRGKPHTWHVEWRGGSIEVTQRAAARGIAMMRRAQGHADVTVTPLWRE